MRYDVAVSAAEMDAMNYAPGMATIEQNADKRRIEVIVSGQVVAWHAYRD